MRILARSRIFFEGFFNIRHLSTIWLIYLWKNWWNLYENFIIDISLENCKNGNRPTSRSGVQTRQLDGMHLGRGLYAIKGKSRQKWHMHAAETGAINRRHKIDARIWSVCHTIWHASGMRQCMRHASLACVNFFWLRFLERVYTRLETCSKKRWSFVSERQTVTNIVVKLIAKLRLLRVMH